MGRSDIHKDAKKFTKNDPRINRNGRPKKLDIKEAVQEAMALEKNGMNGLQAMVMKLLQEAIKKGDVRSAEFLAKYGFGLPNPMPTEEQRDKTPIIVNMTLTTDDTSPKAE